jgi:hypothetical protein
MRIVVAVLAFMIAVPGGRAQPVEQMPEETAYRILFQLMRSWREGAWDAKAQSLWLKNQGVPEQYFHSFWKASERYWRAVQPYEEDLRNIHLRFAGRNDSAEARAAEKPTREKITEQYLLAKQELERELGGGGMAHLERVIARIRAEGRRAGARPVNGPAAGHAH